MQYHLITTALIYLDVQGFRMQYLLIPSAIIYLDLQGFQNAVLTQYILLSLFIYKHSILWNVLFLVINTNSDHNQ